MLHTSLYAGDKVCGKHNRHDAVEFTTANGTSIGIIESIFTHRSTDFPASTRLVLTRVLDQMDPEDGNCTVVLRYGHLRYQYSVSQLGFVNTVLVHSSDLLQPIMVVIDPYWLKQNHGLHILFDQVQDDARTQSSIKFFRLSRYNIYKRSQQQGSQI